MSPEKSVGKIYSVVCLHIISSLPFHDMLLHSIVNVCVE